MKVFYIKLLDGRHRSNQHYAYRVEMTSQSSAPAAQQVIKHFAEARQYLWAVFGASAELDELYAMYGKDNWPCWGWRQHHVAGNHLYLATDQELTAFLLKYAEYSVVDKKIKF